MLVVMYDHVPAELLTPALEAGRAALRRLDDTDVPNKLKKVVAYSGGHLPPPLARSLGRALDEQEDLRTKALDEWDAADLMAPGPVGASALFLIRPDNWQFQLGKLVAVHEEAAARSDIADLTRRLREAEDEAAEGRRRVSDLREELERTKRKAKQPRRDGRKREESGRSASAEDFQRRIAALEVALEEAEAAHLSLSERAQRKDSKLRRVRADRAEALRKAEARSGAGWGSGDPVKLARHLDEVASVVAVGATRVAEYFRETMGFEAGPWKLPPGARPDGANSIEWLMRQPRQFVLLVDGHNLAHKLRPDAASGPGTRDEIVHALARFKLHTKTVVQVVVVFDSSVSPTGDTYRGPSGVEVRFASADSSADDEILTLASSFDDPVAVVSSDREVREGAERFGAIGLWSEAMKEWMRSG